MLPVFLTGLAFLKILILFLAYSYYILTMDYTFYKNKMPVLVQIFKAFVFDSTLCGSNIEAAIHFLGVCCIFIQS